ncbi:hypothetical protein FRB96_007361 [Tulasnella sp. 330]|nr:hypothetical protein FRB96_007361 [Tulasnella sp. 330]KAG8871894.1 hypothetical protein FRB97_008233 [Tulasnella sp. 331]KAG8874982.1 hypothetical protein FRB98_008132 [Tulasnella sp. 332]
MTYRFKILGLHLPAPRNSSRRIEPEASAESWIDRLPVELLINIFEFACYTTHHIPTKERYRLHPSNTCSPPTLQLLDQPSPSPLIPPVRSDSIDTVLVLRLSHVSPRWRDVVTSVPKLWQTLELGQGDPQKKMSAWLIRLGDTRVKEIIIRGPVIRRMLSCYHQDVPLSLPLNLPGNLPPTLRVEIPDNGRQRFDIRLGLENLFGRRVMGLETLEISVADTNEERKERPLTTYTPAYDGHLDLKSLTLRGVSVAPRVLGSANLVCLELREVFWSSTADVFFSVLKTSPNLESLVIADFYSSASIPIRHVGSDTTVLDRLTSLELGGGGHILSYVLIYGRFPKLRSLRMAHARPVKLSRNGSDPKDLLRVLLSKQLVMPLKELHLHGNSFEPKTLARTLARFGEDLELLEISHQWENGAKFNHAVSLLTFPKEQQLSPSDPVIPIWVCPKLTTLIFVECPGLCILRDLVTARERAATKNLVSSIKRLVVEECGSGDADFIRNLMGGGLIEPWRNAKAPEAQRPLVSVTSGIGWMPWIRRRRKAIPS